jgi:hypothetical protein
MKYTIVQFILLGLLCCGLTDYVEAQTTDLLPEASRELITQIDNDFFTFILEKFEEDGVPNLSMSKGFEFIRIGSDLETILNTLWPKFVFDISPAIKKYKYHLTLQHLDQKRTDEFLEKVLKEFLADSGFKIKLNQEIQIHNCVEVEFPDQLNQNLYEPSRGVIRSTTYKGGELTLSGFTLEDIMAVISNESDSIFTLINYDFSDQTFEMSFNVENSETVKESLKGYGLNSSACEREVEVIFFE